MSEPRVLTMDEVAELISTTAENVANRRRLTDEERGFLRIVVTMDAMQGVVDAARIRAKEGHSDTCPYELVEGFACDCGHVALITALAALDASKGE